MQKQLQVNAKNFDEPAWRCVYSCVIVISFHAMVLQGVVLVSSCLLFSIFVLCVLFGS